MTETAPVALPLRPWASLFNINGRAARDLWCCAYPASVPHKSFGLQIAIIVTPNDVELCVCMGARRARVSSPGVGAARDAAWRQLKEGLANLTPGTIEAMAAGLDGWDLRRSWRQAAGSRDFATLQDWVRYAASPDTVGASISRNVAAEDLDARSDTLVDELLGCVGAVAPLFEHVYGDAGRHDQSPPRREAQLEDVASRLFVEPAFLGGVESLLRRKRQLIFYGPPGTGKTFIAQVLAEWIGGERGHGVEVVQFHPAYSYESFVQGYRPRDVEGVLHHKLVDGPLVTIARRAELHPERTFVLLIDEINRGNLPRIFGELLYLLEYRGRHNGISLMYHEPDEDPPFSLPENLLIVATMNTADRSIALIDSALRRRFAFVPLFPGEEPLAGLLRRWLQAHSVEMLWVADLVDLANERITDRLGAHLQIGPSHFMEPDLDQRLLEEIWSAQVLPLIEDHLFGDTEELTWFSLKKLCEEVQPGADDRADGAPAEG